ncbi:unnamed protein product, partial [Rotaria sordida]
KKSTSDLVEVFESMGIPRFLGSMSRGLLGLESTVDHLNPVHVLQELENQLPDNAILINPGVFGTLGVGTEFALGAKLVRPEASVWIIYGNGALGYSIMKYDTFIRHNVYE